MPVKGPIAAVLGPEIGYFRDSRFRRARGSSLRGSGCSFLCFLRGRKQRECSEGRNVGLLSLVGDVEMLHGMEYLLWCLNLVERTPWLKRAWVSADNEIESHDSGNLILPGKEYPDISKSIPNE